MEDTNDQYFKPTEESWPIIAMAIPIEMKPNMAATTPDQAASAEQHPASTIDLPVGVSPKPSEAKPASHLLRNILLFVVVIFGLAVGGYLITPRLATALNTVSTDDAYVNGHVTFVAPRVGGQVLKVLVDDNYRVKKGDLLVQLDPEPYLVQVEIKKAAVESAETDLKAAQAQVRGQVAQARANRYKLEHAIEDVDNQIANLRAVWRHSTAGGRLCNWRRPISNGEKNWLRAGPSPKKNSTCSRKRLMSQKRASSKPFKRSTPFVSAWAFRRRPLQATT